MRLSEVMNRAPDRERTQVENFLGTRRIGWGQHKKLDVGKVVHNFYCRECAAVRTFISAEKLACLVAGDQLVSIDVSLQCPVCPASVEAWYLIAGYSDLYVQSPVVYLDRYTENRRDLVTGVGTGGGQFEDLLDRAQTAYEQQLGAGSMVYLRKIFEAVTKEVATIAGIATTRPGGSRRPFRHLLEEVDREHHIIPAGLSRDGYRLFGELSQVIHGDTSEDVALRKYSPCRQLVLSVLRNVIGDREIARAIDALGWDVGNLVAIAGEEIAT
jgi:hypothetical protein